MRRCCFASFSFVGRVGSGAEASFSGGAHSGSPMVSDLLPDHKLGDEADGFNNDDYGDLVRTLDLLQPADWNGAKVHVVLLGRNRTAPSRLPDASI